ncbi:hypothetical protein D3C84_1055540 [compost metagenome]
MGGEVFLLDEAHIVGRDQRRTEPLGQGHGAVQLLFIVGAVGALDFQIKTVRKHFHPFASQGFGLGRVAAEHGLADLAFLGRRQHDQARVGFSNPFAFDDDRTIALTVDEAA